MERSCSTPTFSGLTCDAEVPAVAAPAPKPKNEPGLFLAAAGGALGTMAAVAVLAGLAAFFGDGFGASAQAAGLPPSIATVTHARHLGVEAPDVLRRAAPAKPPAHAPPHARHAPRTHHAARAAHPAPSIQSRAADAEVASALARAELASVL